MSYEDMSVDEAVSLLRKWRENNERRSAEVMEIWRDLLMDKTGNLGNETYLINEQVIFAALDCHDDWSEEGISDMMQLFPGSLRVLRFKAASLEAMEKYDEALETLEQIISADETNAPARKRKVTIYLALGLLQDAIKELVDYLKKFMSDAEAWQQLCELYLRAGELPRAVFCAEELLLHQPHSSRAHQRVADVRYTMGGVENLELAKTYYCQALKLNAENARARLGLILVTNSLLTHYKSSGNAGKRKEVARLAAWAGERGAGAAGGGSGGSGGDGLAQVMAALTVGE